MASGRGGFERDFCRCTVEVAEAFFECVRAGTSFLTLVESFSGEGEYIPVGEGNDLCFFAGEIQLSSGRGLRTALDGGLAVPWVTPVELDRVGMAFGEAGFSSSIGGIKG